MIELPRRISDIFDKLKCPNCKKTLKPDRVVAEGIRNSVVEANKTAFFVEYDCPFCEQHSTLELTIMTVEDFVMEMLDRFTEDDSSEEKKQHVKKKKKQEKTKITDSEYKEAIRFVRNCEDNIAFLTGIGMNTEDIDKYAYYKNKDKG